MLCENMFEKMNRYSIVVILVLILVTGCGNGQSAPAREPVAPTIVVTAQPTITAMVYATATLPAQLVDATPTAMTFVWVTDPNCAGDGVNSIGQSIADDYESASYEQVMAWFCNGAEFEDIMVALETAAQTDATADEMLKMLADGFTWDEIWQAIGLVSSN